MFLENKSLVEVVLVGEGELIEYNYFIKGNKNILIINFIVNLKFYINFLLLYKHWILFSYFSFQFQFLQWTIYEKITNCDKTKEINQMKFRIEIKLNKLKEFLIKW